MKLSLIILPEKFAVCRLEKDSPISLWALKSPFFTISRTDDELSVVCTEQDVPDGIIAEKNRKAFKVAGTLDFSLTGILASIANPLAEARISIFAISTYNTDYILVKENVLAQAVKVLSPGFDIQFSK